MQLSNNCIAAIVTELKRSDTVTDIKECEPACHLEPEHLPLRQKEIQAAQPALTSGKQQICGGAGPKEGE